MWNKLVMRYLFDELYSDTTIIACNTCICHVCFLCFSTNWQGIQKYDLIIYDVTVFIDSVSAYSIRFCPSQLMYQVQLSRPILYQFQTDLVPSQCCLSFRHFSCRLLEILHILNLLRLCRHQSVLPNNDGT